MSEKWKLSRLGCGRGNVLRRRHCAKLDEERASCGRPSPRVLIAHWVDFHGVAFDFLPTDTLITSCQAYNLFATDCALSTRCSRACHYCLSSLDLPISTCASVTGLRSLPSTSKSSGGVRVQTTAEAISLSYSQGPRSCLIESLLRLCTPSIETNGMI